MRYKKGVKIAGLVPEVVAILPVVNDVYKGFGYECWVTAGLNGKHMKNSKHYTGEAIDIRTRVFCPAHVTATIRRLEKNNNVILLNKFRQAVIDRMTDLVVTALKGRLTDEFDIVPHPTHIHIEFDPK